MSNKFQNQLCDFLQTDSPESTFIMICSTPVLNHLNHHSLILISSFFSFYSEGLMKSYKCSLVGAEEQKRTPNKGARLEIFSCNQWPVPQCSRKLQYYVSVSPSLGNSDSPPNTRPREENLWFTDHSFPRVRQECGHVWWLRHIIHG